MNKNDSPIAPGLSAACLAVMLSLVSFAGVAWAEAAARHISET